MSAPAQVGGVQNMGDCWSQTKDMFASVGQWITKDALYFVVWIKDRIVDLFGTVKDAALAAFQFIMDKTAQAYATVVPYLTSAWKNLQQTATETYNFVRNYVNAHPNETMVGLAALAIGAVTALAIEHICC